MSLESLMWCDDSLSSDSFLLAVEEAERAALSLADFECTPSVIERSPPPSCSYMNISSPSSPSLLMNSDSTSFNFRSTPLSDSESSFCSLQLPETYDISPTLEIPEIVDISSSDNSVEILSSITSSSVKSSYCQCEKKVICELCIWEAIKNCEYDDNVLLCAACYCNVPNEMGHDCLRWDLELVDRTSNIVLNPTNVMHIYNAYLLKHEKCDECSLVIFKWALCNLLQRKVEEIKNELIVKDSTAEVKFC